MVRKAGRIDKYMMYLLALVSISSLFLIEMNSINNKLEQTCLSSFSNATSRDSLTIIENEPRCAAYIKDE